jgi:hypothetical protein
LVEPAFKDLKFDPRVDISFTDEERQDSGDQRQRHGMAMTISR